jgi:phosphoserine aminotransferase
MEALLWSLLGERGVDVLANCIFSNHWANDVLNELKIPDTHLIKEDFPRLPDVSGVNFARDVVFCLSSTTSGASFHNLNWIPQGRGGLVVCDAASAVFAMDFDWSKLDAVAFSWQKGLGGEAGFGTIVLGPRAIERLRIHKPIWPIPRIFRIAENKNVLFDLFNDGKPINTPSMICLEDFYNNLLWAKSIGGLNGLMKKVESNYAFIKEWIDRHELFDFLVDEQYRAQHITCLDILDSKYQRLSKVNKWKFLKKIVNKCEIEETGFDFLGHILTEPHLRIWTGPTIEVSDLERFLPWMELAYHAVALDL